MNNRIRRQTYPDAPQEGAKTAKSGATNNTLHPLTASRARALAVQRLNSFGKSRKGGANERKQYAAGLEDLSGRTAN